MRNFLYGLGLLLYVVVATSFAALLVVVFSPITYCLVVLYFIFKLIFGLL